MWTDCCDHLAARQTEGEIIARAHLLRTAQQIVTVYRTVSLLGWSILSLFDNAASTAHVYIQALYQRKALITKQQVKGTNPLFELASITDLP